MKYIYSHRRGTVLVLVIVMLLIVVTIAGSITHILVMDSRQYRWDHHALQAERLAESGLRRARAQLAAGSTYEGETWSPELPAGPAEVTIKITTEDNAAFIISRATFPINSNSSVRASRTRKL